MRTRRASYGAGEPGCMQRRSRSSAVSVRERPPGPESCAKRARLISSQKNIAGKGSSCFDKLPDDVVLSILVWLSSRADTPRDLLNVKSICKRFKRLASNSVVMRNASEGALRVRACQWCAAATIYLSTSAEAGNLEACFTLGMIRFYCLLEREEGLEMLRRAASRSHAGALHALGVIHFNGSGGSRADKNLKAGVHLCARAAALGHVDAMRELGHCLQDGYGVPMNVLHGRRLILEANVREASLLATRKLSLDCGVGQNKLKVTVDSLFSIYKLLHSKSCSLLSDFGCTSVLPPTLHIAHEFLLGWFRLKPLPMGLRLCSHANCGRPETRKHEFRRCSACGRVNYCSRACQALDWKLQHKLHCASAIRWPNRAFVIGLPRRHGPSYMDDSSDQ
ncbi:hypothetical protein GOP47_0023363 [Adiantum capillus-veneris]|uniref:MYND-type domain-containing protein n=1 Tax=Adiantum capillus-veneris TaxID=13818 RepID=A0A9D4U4I0_ADICA|nr:hypothetical protein GOP47_0023363 [Adiantum capillus-veneris]